MMAPRCILLLNYEYPPLGGGAANATLFLAQALIRLGHRVVVVTSGLGTEQHRREEAGVIVHRLRTGRAAPDRSTMREMCAYLLAAARHAPRIARAEHCDAVVAFFTIPSGGVARWLKWRAALPYVVSLRGSDVPGHDVTLNRMHRLTRPIRRAILRQAEAIVANSEGLAATSRVADPFPVRIIPNGVDCTLFHPGESSPGPAPLRLLFVGRVHREKNLGVVLQQLAALPPAVRERFELCVAGDGAQRPELTARAAELGLAGQVHWLGWQDKSELPALYRRADALVNPSLYEGMSNVVLEAMASGLPVFASNVPGNQAVVRPGETGVLFPLQDPSQLGAALLRLAVEPEWGRRLGQAGRRWAEADFSWARTAQSYLELLPRPGPL